MDNKTIIPMPVCALNKLSKKLDFPEMVKFLETGDFIVAGGWCRDVFIGRKPRDCDVFEMTGTSAMHKKELPGNVQWVPTQRITNGGRTARRVILKFDFSCNMACVYREAGEWRGLCHVRWESDCRSKTLHVPITSSTGLSNETVVRLGRLVDAGWRVMPGFCDTGCAETGYSS